MIILIHHMLIIIYIIQTVLKMIIEFMYIKIYN